MVGGQALFSAPRLPSTRHVQAVLATHAQLPAMWLECTWGWGCRRWVADTGVRTDTDQKSPQFTTQGFPWKLQAFNRLHGSKIDTRYRFTDSNSVSRWQDSPLVLSTPPSSQNLLLVQNNFNFVVWFLPWPMCFLEMCLVSKCVFKF